MYCGQLAEEDLDRALKMGVVDKQTEYVELYQRYGDLYAGIYPGEEFEGTCCGWPFYEVRSDQPSMQLVGIVVTQEHRRKGYGSQLLQYWEQQVAKRGRWLISLGSAPDADMFYVKMGYFTIEYAIKVDKAILDPDFRNMGYEITYVKYTEDPDIVLHIPANGRRYEPDLKQMLVETFSAHDAITIFGKHVG